MQAEGPGVVDELTPRRWPASICTSIQASSLGGMVSAQPLLHVLLDDEIKKVAIHYARQGCASSCSTTGESLIPVSECSFSVRSHIVGEEGDGGSSGDNARHG